MQKGDIVELKVEKYAFEGKGIAILNLNNDGLSDSFVIFVNGAYPGDIISARVVKKKKSYAEAVVESILNPSQHRTQPRCKYFGTCGGCRQQDLIYEQQINYKLRDVSYMEDTNRPGRFDRVFLCCNLESGTSAMQTSIV